MSTSIDALAREAARLRVPMTHSVHDREYLPVLAYRVSREIVAAENRLAALRVLSASLAGEAEEPSTVVTGSVHSFSVHVNGVFVARVSRPFGDAGDWTVVAEDGYTLAHCATREDAIAYCERRASSGSLSHSFNV